MTSKTRERRFLALISTLQSEVEDAKQRRPTDAAPTIARSAQSVGSVATDGIAYESTQNPTFTYGDPERGYGRGEWGSSGIRGDQ